MKPLRDRLTPHQRYKRMEKQHRREAERIVNGPAPSGDFRGFLDILRLFGTGAPRKAVRHSTPEGARPAEQ